MTYSGEVYCQHINAYIDCGNRKCSECSNSKKKETKNKHKEQQKIKNDK